MGQETGFRPHGAMLKYPDISAEHVVFVYGGDLWLAPREGGQAWMLATTEGGVGFPKFDPHGKTLVFMGRYDGNTDLYSVPVTGGVPQRLTAHPAREMLCDFTPDGDRLLFFAEGMGDHPHSPELFQLDLTKGTPKKLPMPYGAFGALHANGHWLAYTPNTRDFRTWKRYRGGWASDIWVFDLQNLSARRITEFEGTDTQPMWHEDLLVFLSDAHPSHRLNLFTFDMDSDTRSPLTDLSDHDIRWPSMGPGPEQQGEVVFQYGANLMRLPLDQDQPEIIEITLPGTRPHLRTQAQSAGDLIFNLNISPSGKRALVEARGDIWTLPAEHGSARNLTRTNGRAERDPTWSPDGKWIVFASDEEASYDLYLLAADGSTPPTRLTQLESPFLHQPTWSPDSKRIAFWDKAGVLYLVEVETHETRSVDQDPYARRSRVRWSPDSQWLTYTRSGPGTLPSVWIANASTAETQRITSPMFAESDPCFDPKGETLYFLSRRDFSDPIYEDVGTTWVYAGTSQVLALPLTLDKKSPVAPQSDEETIDLKKTEDEENGKKKDEDKDKGKDDAQNASADEDIKPVKIDFQLAEQRAVILPVKSGEIQDLDTNHQGHLLYIRRPVTGSRSEPDLVMVDLEDEDREEKSVLSGVQAFAMSADGEKILVLQGGKYAIVDAKPQQKAKPMDTSHMRVQVDPRQEWHQVFHEAWRLVRDYFYDPHMHGVDWEAVRDHYAAMLPDCHRREDVSDLIREMIAELNVGHAYYYDAPGPRQDSDHTGMLGADLILDDGVVRIGSIYEGAAWDADARGPLRQPGVKIEKGDQLLAVNGIQLGSLRSPWIAFADLEDQVVTLTVRDRTDPEAKPREEIVKLHGFQQEMELRYRAWIESRRRMVETKSDGKVGYIYVVNTGIQGQNDLVRQFHGQRHKQALIIDERWNGGGQIPTRFVELLNRPVANYWALRDGEDWVWPPDAHHGPKCMLINGLAGSGGDYFPYWFRKAGVGKLIGTRTWGGLVGISGNPVLIDGGRVAVPRFAFYETDGTWGIEGHGVEPDIEVLDDPAKLVNGGDPQLDAAIDLMLKTIAEHPPQSPPRPAYPDRSGMGIPETDR